MYKLFSRVDQGLQCVIDRMSSFLRETGRGLVSIETSSDATPGKNATVYIQSLLDLRDQYNVFLEKSFSNDSSFRQAIGVVSGHMHACTHACTLSFCCRILNILST